MFYDIISLRLALNTVYTQFAKTVCNTKSIIDYTLNCHFLARVVVLIYTGAPVFDFEPLFKNLPFFKCQKHEI